MIHFTCDGCKRVLDPEYDVRYVVRMEVYASLEPVDVEMEGDRDNLQEIDEILERLDDANDSKIGDDVYQQVRYDLCSSCRSRFLKDPLGRAIMPKFNFSEN